MKRGRYKPRVWRAPDIPIGGLLPHANPASVAKMKEFDSLSPEWQELMKKYGFSNVSQILATGATPEYIRNLCRAKLPEPI